MCRGKIIPSDERAKIITMHELGCSLSKIGLKVVSVKWDSALRGCSKRTTTPRKDRKIVNLALQNRRATLEGLGNTVRSQYGIKISDKTVRQRLHEAKLFGLAARMKPLLMKRHREARLKWYLIGAWCASGLKRKVIWSDESKFCLIGNRGCQRVWRRSGEALKPECVNSTVKQRW